MTTAAPLLAPAACLTLWLTTARCRFRVALPERAAGWRIRLAALKWDYVWRDCHDTQARARVIVMPLPDGGQIGVLWTVLLQHRLHRLKLGPRPPDPELLLAAERDLLRRLAPGWIDAIGRFQ